jgi:tRNA 5-methylaminomethyl-2-thiouridine biosynthesis bifunctional protein
MDNEKKKERFRKTAQNWNWSPDHLRLVGADEASEIAGIKLGHGALYLPCGGSVSPPKLCDAYMRDVQIQLNAPIENLKDIDADIKILACGTSVLKFAPDLPIIPVRGQITQIKATTLSATVKCNICCNGYFMPAVNDTHNMGATFQPDLNHSDIIDEDDLENIEKLNMAIPELGPELEVTGQRASVRATSRHRFPIVGLAPGHDNVYFSAAHGSHGILSSIMSAHLLADIILDRPRSLPKKVIAALSPQRFANRA